ncbi:MAG: catalase [Deltaproteobacteria bacterium]|nr:catalase [Deltaproteobacteria bacterium]
MNLYQVARVFPRKTSRSPVSTLTSTFGLVLSLALFGCPSKNTQVPMGLIQDVGVLAPIDVEVGEVRELSEEKCTQEILEAVYGKLVKDHHPDSDENMPRDAHVKMHGCVVGSFVVDEALESAFQVGVFSLPGKKYDAIVRFSNSDAKKQKDSKPDARGMAIKLLGVPGDKLLPDEKGAMTQDFMLLNSDRFFVKNLKEYVEVLRAIEKGVVARDLWFASHPHALEALMGAFNNPMRNPALHTYHSATPYLLGKQAIKYFATPCELKPAAGVEVKTGKNALRDAMKQTFATEEVCYSFYAEERTVPAVMPIEDATVSWPKDQLRRVKLGTFTLPMQDFDTDARRHACENYSFTPWHSLPVHKPLGAVNRARYSVYELISRFRNKQNQVPHAEPTSLPEG